MSEKTHLVADKSSQSQEGYQIASLAASALSSKKAHQVIALDLRGLSDVCDYMVIATGSNNRQVDALVDVVEERVAKELNDHPLSIEGRDERRWVLMDYGIVLVNIFTDEARDYYRLEKLWGDAPQIDLGLDEY
ncbi:ribosome silencing factor [Collinsella sp. AGMB00827]|uniref:Ribosomal silencing factor RsfS n=1 Tax=Collinsella ureilytica TaxID=2869515 RepID=A0ABS7ML08_9ACTN|nr:ribosome silencing factor [Collinsella urealyticum]MBY4798057.1 ribosome silencing factor [Collinsella urealyticum]